VNEDNRMVTGVMVGAVLGAAAAYLIVTSSGRGTIDHMDAALADVTAGLERFRGALRRADGLVHEARGAVDDVRAMLKGQP
jgi:gas vesicle protein